MGLVGVHRRVHDFRRSLALFRRAPREPPCTSSGTDRRWEQASGKIVEDLVTVNSAFLGLWSEGFCPVKDRLLEILRNVVANHRGEILKQRGYLLEEDLGRARQSSIDRRAISRVLVELGYFSFLWSNIAPHNKSV